MNPERSSLRLRARLVLLASLLALCSAAPGARAESDEARGALGFADQLLAQGEPGRAVQEYLRALYFTGWDTSATSLASVNGVARAHLAAEEYDQVVRWGQRLDARGFRPCGLGNVRLATAAAYLRLAHPREAGTELERVGACPGDSALTDRRDLLLGIRDVQLGDWGAADRHFGAVPPASSLARAAAEYRERARLGRTLPRHSGRLAGFLGVVPGLGYLYDGFPQTAIAALLVTGTFAEASREAFRHDQPALGWFAAAFGSSWYAGSIYGSVTSARRVDQFYRDRFLRDFVY